MPHAEVPKRLKASAKSLRKAMTDSERKLWAAIRAHRLEGLGFRRQMPLLGCVVDFASPECRLVIEVDGSQHARDANVKRDEDRDARLASEGWMVLRFWSHDVLADIDGVCETIWLTARDRRPQAGRDV